jgi:hypothetical protein
MAKPTLLSSKPMTRAAEFDFNFLPDDTDALPNTPNLTSFDEQNGTRMALKETTTNALKELQEQAADTLKKLEFFKLYYGDKIPKNCEGIDARQVSQLNGADIGQLCRLANLELLLNQAESMQIKAKEYPELFKEGKLNPDLNPIKWRMFLKKIKLTDKKARELLGYLDGVNKLSAFKKAAKYDKTKENEDLVNLEKIPQQKWLREFLTTYKLTGYPIQIALDFNAQDIDDVFIKDIELTDEQKQQQDNDFVNGKSFIKSMVTNMSLPTNFKVANEFAGSELTQKIVKTDKDDYDYYETQKIPFLKEYAEVVLSKEITATVESFEDFDSDPKNNNATMNQASLPLYIIFACQKRKRLSKRKIWQELMKKNGQPDTVEQKKELEAYMNDSSNNDNLYEKDNGGFIYDSFHLSIVILCNGKIYTLGYGSDPFADDEEVKKEEGDEKVKRLKKIEELLRKGGKIGGVDLENVQLLGTGYIYSPDSLNVDEDAYNYDIIDIGILEKCHVIRLNKLLATIKRVRAITMVVGKDDAPRNVTVERFSGQTMCVYSRLASIYNQYIPVASQFMNCSSFVEAVFYDRINCTTPGFYSDPNACVKIQEPYSKTETEKKARITRILNAYFGEGTLNEFKGLVNYRSHVPPEVAKDERTWNELARKALKYGPLFLATVLGPALIGGDAEIKLKKRKKLKRPKNTTARK